MGPKLTPPRKKACNNCSKAKVRCELGRPTCSRCRNRDLQCLYTSDKSPDRASTSAAPQSVYNSVPIIPSKSLPSSSTDALDFDNVLLICAVDEHRIRARWLESLLPSIDQRPKPFTLATMNFVSRVLQSYPGIFLEDDALPPFIHWSQFTSVVCEPLANCANLARMWKTQTTGSASMVREVIEQEMTRLFQQES